MAVFQQKKSNKVSLDDTVPLMCTIEHAHNIKDHTEYVIKVQRGPLPDNSWTVNKRYSDFDALDVALKATGITLHLPPKKVFGKMDREFVAERQQGLQNYLTVILSHPIITSSVIVKQFLDPTNYDLNLRENALQQISMFFRAENTWEVIEPLPDIGWRIRKQYFMIKNKQQPKDRYVLSWNTLGPDKFLDDRDLEYCMKLLSTFQHPHIFPLAFATSNDTSGIAIRPYLEQGTLRDLLCKVVKPRTSYFKKYSCPKQSVCCHIHEIRLFSRQILDTLKYLHDKGLAYGHLHASNVVVANSRVMLLDMENWFLGLPSCYRQYYTQFRKIQTLEAVDVYSFGQLLYEMSFGEPLNAATYTSLPMGYPADLSRLCDYSLVLSYNEKHHRLKKNILYVVPFIFKQRYKYKLISKALPSFYFISHINIIELYMISGSVLDCILTVEACKNGLPSISDLLQHPFFNELVLPPTEKPQIKIPSKIKEVLKKAKEHMERRLREEQKVIHQFKRLSKAQAHLMSDEEKKKRQKSKKKQLMENGGSDAQPNGTVATASERANPSPPPSSQQSSTAAPPPPPPPPPPPMTASANVVQNIGATPAPSGGDTGRHALLGSIQNFSKQGLKSTETHDKSGPLI